MEVAGPGPGRGARGPERHLRPPAAAGARLPARSRGVPRRKWRRRGEWKPRRGYRRRNSAGSGPEVPEGVGSRPSGPWVGRGWPRAAGSAPTCGPGRQPPAEA